MPALAGPDKGVQISVCSFICLRAVASTCQHVHLLGGHQPTFTIVSILALKVCFSKNIKSYNVYIWATIERGQGSGFLFEGSSSHCLYERAAEVLARLRGCAGSTEPSLLA